jgi:hypothetical protein
MRHTWRALLSATLTLMVSTGTALAQPKKPNILVIWGDDIGWFNISAYNHGMMGYKTPNIDRLSHPFLAHRRGGQPPDLRESVSRRSATLKTLCILRPTSTTSFRGNGSLGPQTRKKPTLRAGFRWSLSVDFRKPGGLWPFRPMTFEAFKRNVHGQGKARLKTCMLLADKQLVRSGTITDVEQIRAPLRKGRFIGPVKSMPEHSRIASDASLLAQRNEFRLQGRKITALAGGR